MNDIVAFKRMNFFHGFFTSADDWNDGQKYHLEKRRLHNRTMHTPGIVQDTAQELRVLASGNTVLEIQPGNALDGNGKEIYVSQAQQLAVDLSDYDDNSWIYVALRYDEHGVDYVEYEDKPFKGYARIAELFKIELRPSAPTGVPWVELARIYNKAGMAAITNDDIDRSHVRWAGAVGVELPRLPPAIVTLFTTVLEVKRQSYARLGEKIPVPSASDVRNAALTIWILVITNGVSADSAVKVLKALAEVEADVLNEIATTYPGITGLSGYSEYEDAIDALQSLVNEAAPIEQILDQAAEVNSEIADFLMNDFKPKAKPVVAAPTPTQDEETTVVLDGSESSSAFGEAFYHWNRRSHTPGA